MQIPIRDESDMLSTKDKSIGDSKKDCSEVQGDRREPDVL